MLQSIIVMLPIGIAVALSSVPILATIVLLLSTQRAKSSVPFLIGWVLGMVGVVVFFTLTAQLLPASRSPRRPDTVIGVLEIIVGAALLVLAVIEWINARRHPSATMPKWLSKVDSIGPWQALG